MQSQWCFTFWSIYLIVRNFRLTCFVFIINAYQITIAYRVVVFLSVSSQVCVIRRVKLAKVHDVRFCYCRINIGGERNLGQTSVLMLLKEFRARRKEHIRLLKPTKTHFFCSSLRRIRGCRTPSAIFYSDYSLQPYCKFENNHANMFDLPPSS